jgi:hypothetical protein
VQSVLVRLRGGERGGDLLDDFMSLYNMLFGVNPFSEVLLAMLGLSRGDCGRYRDCFTNDDGTEIIVHTRNGGGNREDYQSVFEALSKHPNYLNDADDDFDCTYADIRFSVPEQFREHVKKIADQTDTTPPAERWQKLFQAMESGTENQTVSRALEVGKKIFGAIQSGQTGPVKTTEGEVRVEHFNPPKDGQ